MIDKRAALSSLVRGGERSVRKDPTAGPMGNNNGVNKGTNTIIISAELPIIWAQVARLVGAKSSER
mgnify:CR=1 FL=1